MSNDIDPRTNNTPDTNDEAAAPNQPQTELSDDELSNVSGGAVKVPDDLKTNVRKAGEHPLEY